MSGSRKVTMKAAGKHATGLALGVCAALLGMGSAQAGVTLNSARVGAVDVAALEKFYEAAFGMQEVQKIGTTEVMLNFGDTVAAAKANPGSQIVIMHRDSDETKDTIAHVIFNVTDMNATVAAITAAGGKMERAPFVFGNSGITIGLGVDPAGNHFEMLQQPKH
jgi:predicted enzyme related to lactoylglutathione lyase